MNFTESLITNSTEIITEPFYNVKLFYLLFFGLILITWPIVLVPIASIALIIIPAVGFYAEIGRHVGEGIIISFYIFYFITSVLGIIFGVYISIHYFTGILKEDSLFISDVNLGRFLFYLAAGTFYGLCGTIFGIIGGCIGYILPGLLICLCESTILYISNLYGIFKRTLEVCCPTCKKQYDRCEMNCQYICCNVLAEATTVPETSQQPTSQPTSRPTSRPIVEAIQIVKVENC